MYDDPRIEETDAEEDFPAPPPPVAQPAVPNHGGYQVRYDRYTRQPYRHGSPSSGFYLPPGPSGPSVVNRGDVDLREYADLLTEDNTPTNEMEQYRSALQLNQLYPQLPGDGNSGRRNGNQSPTEDQVREWGATSPIAENIRRVMSDGSFAQGHASETNKHWDFGRSPSGMVQDASGPTAQTPNGGQQNLVQQQSDFQNMLVFPGVSAAISSKVDSLADTVKGLVTALYDVVGRVNDIESNSRPSSVRPPSVASVPEHLQPRQAQGTVDPVHKQRLQKVLASAPRKQVQFNEVPRAISATPQNASSDSRVVYPPFPETVRRPRMPPPGFTAKAHMPTTAQHAAMHMPFATRMVPGAYPESASFIAPQTGHRYHLPPDAHGPFDQREQQYAPQQAYGVPHGVPTQQAFDTWVQRPTHRVVQQSMPQDEVRHDNRPVVLDYGHSEYAQIDHRPAEVTGHHPSIALPGANLGINSRQSPSHCASENSLVQLLLFSTVSQQIKKLAGRDGLERAKDYFREFEGLTRAWDDKQRLDLLGIKVIDSARLAFEAYEKDVSRPLFAEAKQAILDALSVEDNRKVGAWSDLKNLQQTDRETVTEFGTRVKQTVRDAMGHMQSSSQLEELNKKYFIDGLRDIGIRRSLAAQLERSRYTDLIRDGAVIERSCPSEAPEPPQAVKATASAPNHNRSSGAHHANGDYTGGYNGPRRYYGNSYTRNNSGNQAHNQQPYAQARQSSGGYAQQNNGYRQYNGTNQRQGWQNNTFQRDTFQRPSAPNATQQPNLTGGNAVRQAQNFQFPRSPSWQGAANTGSTSQ